MIKLKIKNCKIEYPKFLLVCSYPTRKILAHIGCNEAKSHERNQYQVGIWRISYKQ